MRTKVKNNKTVSLFWKAFVVIIFIPILWAAFSMMSVRFAVEDSDKASYVDWKKEYPFKETSTVTDASENNSSSDLKLYVRRYKRVLTKLNSIWDKVPTNDTYDRFSQIGIWLNSKISDISSSSEYVLLKNGLWCQKKKKADKTTYDKYVADVADLYEYLCDRDIEMFYILPPAKNCKYESLLPYGSEDYTNDNLDLLREKIEEAGITVLDLRDALHNDGMKHEDMFYVSDHHWTVDTGRWAALKAASFMNQEYNAGLNLEILDSEYYHIEDYGEIEFGSAGNSLGSGIVGPDDFCVPFPDFTTNIEMSIPGINVNKSGSFEDVFINFESLNEIKKKPGSAYGTLLYGNNAVTFINNKETGSEVKVLMLKDSYSLAMAPYFSLTCKELSMLDLRGSMNGFDGSVQSFIEENKPDYVIVMYGYVLDRDLK